MNNNIMKRNYANKTRENTYEFYAMSTICLELKVVAKLETDNNNNNKTQFIVFKHMFKV